MTPQQFENDNWELESIQTRFYELYGIELTNEQAKVINLFEQGKSTYSGKFYLSTWEEWDYELWAFEKILTAEQFSKFEGELQASVKHNQKELMEQDQKSINDIQYHKERIKYYEEDFLAEFLNDPILYTLGSLSNEKAKVKYLKTEYKRYLDDLRMKIISDHFRHYRSFKPKALEAALLTHRLSCLWPDYSYFTSQMDEPTKAIAEYLAQKLTVLTDRYDEILLTKLELLRVFEKDCFDKYYGENRGGWQVTIESKTTPEEEKEARAICLILLDKELYGN